MKLKEHDFQDQVIGAEKEMQFEIDSDNHVIFEILRNKMYSDKIASLCREIASNARDANREAGRGDQPIEIAIKVPDQLMTQNGLCITFKDKGKGISPERMSDVFIKYGSSTKRETDSQTGGFGLGAKTPFAYTDSFTIITICDVDGKRIKYEYSAIIDKSNKGKMILFDSQETIEPTGTQIIVPLEESDRYKFEKECMYSTLMWLPRPNLIGFDREFQEVHYESNFINQDEDVVASLIESHNVNEYGRNHMVCLDRILYPLNTNHVKCPHLPGYKYDVILYFETGELTVSANREQLQYDEDTIKAINNRVEEVKKLAEVEFNHRMDSVSNNLEKAHLIYSAKKESEHPIATLKALAGGELKKYKCKTQIELRAIEPIMVHWTGGKWKYERMSVQNNVTDLWLDKVYWLDARKDARRNITITKHIEGNMERRFIILNPISAVMPEALYREMDELVNYWEIDLHFYSDVEKAEQPKSSSVSKKYAKKTEITIKCQEVYGYGACESEELIFNKETRKITDVTKKDFAYIVGDLSRTRIRGLRSTQASQVAFLKNQNKDLEVFVIGQSTFDRYFKNNANYESLEMKMEKVRNKASEVWLQQTRLYYINKFFNEEIEQFFVNPNGEVMKSIIKHMPLPITKLYSIRQSLIQQGVECKDMSAGLGSINNDEIIVLTKHAEEVFFEWKEVDFILDKIWPHSSWSKMDEKKAQKILQYLSFRELGRRELVQLKAKKIPKRLQLR